MTSRSASLIVIIRKYFSHHDWRGADFMEREVFDLMGLFFYRPSQYERIFLFGRFQAIHSEKLSRKCCDKL
jgi:hypothetical protein